MRESFQLTVVQKGGGRWVVGGRNLRFRVFPAIQRIVYSAEKLLRSFFRHMLRQAERNANVDHNFLTVNGYLVRSAEPLGNLPGTHLCVRYAALQDHDKFVAS